MSWIRFRLGRGTVRVKPRSQMRSYETDGVVPTLNLGPLVVSWWSDDAQRRYDGGRWHYEIDPKGSGPIAQRRKSDTN